MTHGSQPFDVVDPHELWVSTVTEAQFQSRVILHARSLGYSVYHHTTAGGKCRQCGTRVTGGRIVTSKGWPDLVIARADPPRFIIAELKKETGRQTPEQRTWQATLEAVDVEYYLWKPSDWSDIERILEGDL